MMRKFSTFLSVLLLAVLMASCKSDANDVEEKSINERAQSNFNAGLVLLENNEFDDALPHLLESVDQFELAGNFSMQVKALLRISLASHDLGNYDKGIEYAHLAKKILDENPQIDRNLYWYMHNDAGINYDDSKRPQEAIQEHLNALSYAADASDSSYSYNNLGNTYKKLNRLDEAEQFFVLSLQNSHNYQDDYHFATIHSNITDIERLKKNYARAFFHLDSAFFYANRSNSVEKLLDIYYYSYELNNETGDYKAAAEDLVRYIHLKDSIFTSEKNAAVLRYQTKYETEKKEKLIAETQLQSRQKNIWMILLASAMLIALVVFTNYNVKSKLKQKQLALENVLLQEQANTKMQEQRLEISRDLHDSIGSQLTFINSILSGIKSSSIISDDKINSKISTLSDFSETSIAELKSVLWVLNADKICLENFKMRLLNFIQNAGNAKDNLKLHFDFDANANSQLTSKQALNLFRVIQEIVNNTIKYANANEIAIEIKQSENDLHLQISDDGIGFNLEKEKDKSFGINNIQKRISELEGNVIIETSEGNGTKYTIKITLS